MDKQREKLQGRQPRPSLTPRTVSPELSFQRSLLPSQMARVSCGVPYQEMPKTHTRHTGRTAYRHAWDTDSPTHTDRGTSPVPSPTQPNLALEPLSHAWERAARPSRLGVQEPGLSWATDRRPGAGAQGWPPAHLILQLIHTVCLLWAALHELRRVIILMADGGAAQEKRGVRPAVCSPPSLAPAPSALSMEPCSGCNLGRRRPSYLFCIPSF